MAIIASLFATIPLAQSTEAREIGEMLRAVAIKAGCDHPSVRMRWMGAEAQIEISVECLEPQQHETPAPAGTP